MSSTAGLLLQSDIATQGQLFIAGFVVLLFAAITLAVRLVLPYVGLDDDLADTKRALRHSLGAQSPRSLRVTSVESLHERRDAIRELVAGQRDRLTDDQSVTLSEAARLIHTELLTAWSEKTTRIPRLSLQFAEEAVVLLILGTFATVSVESVREAMTAGDGVDLPTAMATAHDGFQTAVTLGLDALAAFPFASTLWALAFAYSVLLAEWVFHNPLAVVAVLVVFAVAVGAIERRAPTVAEVTIVDESRRSLAITAAAAVALVWLAGVVPATIGSALGAPDLGAGLGLAAAGLVALGLGYLVIGVVRVRVRDFLHATDDQNRLVTAGLLLRRVGLGVGALVAPLIPVYAVYIVATGRLLEIGRAFLAGSLGIQLLVGVLLLVGLVGAAIQVRDVWPDVRLAISETLSRRAVRTMAAEKLFPALVFAFLALVGLALELPVVATVAVALTAAILARVIGTNYLRVRDWLDNRESESPTASRVVFDAYTLRTDAELGPLYYVRVNGEPVAACEVERVVDAAIATAEELFTDGEAAPRLEAAHAENALELGIVDIEETRKKLRTETRDILRYADRQGEAGVDDVEETLADEVPEPVWREWVTEKMGHGRLQVRGGEYEFGDQV